MDFASMMLALPEHISSSGFELFLCRRLSARGCAAKRLRTFLSKAGCTKGKKFPRLAPEFRFAMLAFVITGFRIGVNDAYRVERTDPIDEHPETSLDHRFLRRFHCLP